jgi:hypothetical protein
MLQQYLRAGQHLHRHMGTASSQAPCNLLWFVSQMFHHWLSVSLWLAVFVLTFGLLFSQVVRLLLVMRSCTAGCTPTG